MLFFQRTEVPVRPGHPGGRCYKIGRGYASECTTFGDRYGVAG